MSNGPEEPSAGMRAFARTARDMYVALLAEGFTEQQALVMLGVTIQATIAKTDP